MSDQSHLNPAFRYECWFDEPDGQGLTVYAKSAQAAAVSFVAQEHDGSERSSVVVRDSRGDQTAWEVTSKVEWTHTARSRP